MAMSNEDINRINTWAESAGIAINSDIQTKIEKYNDLLLDWTSRMNLVSRNDRDYIIENHFLDSLGPLDQIPTKCRIIDIGSGAGFPGIPLAIFRPEASVTLLESIHKKVIFLQSAIDAVGLKNVIVMEKRLEELSPNSRYEIAAVRALPKREQMIPYVYKILSPSGKIILFVKRGQYSVLENLPA
jgi:16S rRNA (guanine527-N7)-methyltransferase